MATTPTNKPIPSEDPRDLKFNAGKIDEAVNSDAHYYTDRFGVHRWTIAGFQDTAEEAIRNYGYITMDSFEDGNSLTLPNQVLRLKATGEYYRWDGAFPKNVPAVSTPDSTGGIGVGKWLSVGDATLRSDLRKNTGATIIGTDTGDNVQKRIDDIITFQTSVDSEAYSRKNTNYLANADFLIRTKSPIKILFQGDSMTAGLDQKSTDSVPPENGDWARHASITYPERVVSFMSERAGVSVTPVIRAISGQTAKQGFIQTGWDVNPNCNIAVLMYGINDVASSTITEYMEYMEKLIRRFIDWGMGVVVCSLSSGGYGATTQNSQVWARRLKILSNLYGCAYFNAAEVAYQYFTGAATSDGGHFNSSGYSRHGEQFSSFLMGGGLSQEYTPVSQEFVMWPGMISDKHGYYNPQGNLDLTLNYEYTLQGVSGILPSGHACMISFSFYLDAEYAEVDCVGSWDSGGKLSVAVDSPVPVVSYYGYTSGTPSVRKYDSVRETSVASFVSAGMSESGLPKRIAQLVGRGWKTISIFNALDGSSTSQSKIQAVIIRPSLMSKYGQSGSLGVGNVESVIAKFPPSNSSNPSTGGVPDPVALSSQVVLPLPFDLYGKVWDNNISYFDCGMAKLKIKCIGGTQGTSYYEGVITKDSAGYNLKIIDLPNKIGTWPIITARVVLKPESVIVAAGSVSTDMPLTDIRGASNTTVTNSSTGNQYGLFIALNFDWSAAGGVAKTGYYEIAIESPSTGTGTTPVMATL